MDLDHCLGLRLLCISTCWTRHRGPGSTNKGLSPHLIKIVIFWIPSVLQDLPSGMFAGAKIPSKSRARTLIEMSFSLRTIDLDFSSGTFSTSGWMTLEWDDPR